MLKIKIPAVYTLLFGVICAFSGIFIMSYLKKTNAVSNDTDMEMSLQKCDVYKIRLNGYQYVKPLLLAETTCPSNQMNHIQSEFGKIINQFKEQGIIDNASVYLGARGGWITAGDNDKYLPGSLMKVPELITFLKMNEKNPGILNKLITYDKAFISPKSIVFSSRSIELGKTYTVKELLNYMIAYSDNNATMILNSLMDLNVFKKVFTDFGLTEPDLSKKDIPLTPKEFSLFMRAIYNATYLTAEDSEYAAELLSKCDFNKGLMQGIPDGIKVAHKFGEAGDQNNSYLNESAIVYAPTGTYLLTVMLKGKNIEKLPAVIEKISGSTFSLVKNM